MASQGSGRWEVGSIRSMRASAICQVSLDPLPTPRPSSLSSPHSAVEVQGPISVWNVFLTGAKWFGIVDFLLDVVLGPRVGRPWISSPTQVPPSLVSIKTMTTMACQRQPKAGTPNSHGRTPFFTSSLTPRHCPIQSAGWQTYLDWCLAWGGVGCHFSQRGSFRGP